MYMFQDVNMINILISVCIYIYYNRVPDLNCTWSQVFILSPAPQTELSDGIAMMVGNNDRMQGIISQLEETCRAIEVSVQLLQRLAAHSRSKPHPKHKQMHLHSPAQAYKETWCVLVTATLTAFSCLWVLDTEK